MSDLPSSITSRVQQVEEKIASVRSRIVQLDKLVDTEPEEVIRVLGEISVQLQSMRTSVADIRQLVRYN